MLMMIVKNLDKMMIMMRISIIRENKIRIYNMNRINKNRVGIEKEKIAYKK